MRALTEVLRASTERARLSTNGTAARQDVPDPQVPERAQRHTFTTKYKLEILDECERAERSGPGKSSHHPGDAGR